MVTENNLLDTEIRQMAAAAFDCSCGKKHQVDIEKITVSGQIATEVASFVRYFTGKGLATAPVFVVADRNTFVAAAESLCATLTDADVQVVSYVLQREDDLVPNEEAVGELFLALPRDTKLIIAVGSGTINDLCRFVADRSGIPYIIVATAPSVDGYASTVSPLMIQGHKTTIDAVYPKAIFAEFSVLAAAPETLLHAGFGDLLGKVTALTDWELSRQLKGEYFCPAIYALVKKALQLCLSNAKGIATREPEAVSALFEALVLSGLAMGMIGNSRPASGAEHHLAHYWEMDALKNHRPHALHGNAVGAATVAIAQVYALVQPMLPKGFVIPNAEEMKNLLKTVGAAETPAALGISRELFHRSILEAMHIRPRYTVLCFASDHGLLGEVADILTREFYG